MTTTQNGFKFAELARGESLQSPDTCECCERQDLKRTVKLINPAGRVVWYGTGCAAKAMSVGINVVRAARREQESHAAALARIERDRAAHARYVEFQAWLDARVPALRGNRFGQLEALGGMAAARALRAAEP
jgi:hypothetical protein